jgi:phage baseplate assembly protein V
MSDIAKLIKKMLAPIERRVMNMVARGVIERILDDQGLQVHQVSLMAGEVKDNAERVQQYGFTSFPLLGSECVVIFPFGNRDHPLVISTDNRGARLRNLDEGDSALYTGQGNYIRMQYEDGKIYLDAPHNIIIRSDETVRLEGKEIELHATERIKWDCGGRGYDYLPTKTDTWETCTVSGDTNDCDPPEHGTPPAS